MNERKEVEVAGEIEPKTFLGQICVHCGLPWRHHGATTMSCPEGHSTKFWPKASTIHLPRAPKPAPQPLEVAQTYGSACCNSMTTEHHPDCPDKPAPQPAPVATVTRASLHLETCMKCGGGNITWFAPSPVWNQVMRSGPDPNFPDVKDGIDFSTITASVNVEPKSPPISSPKGVELPQQGGLLPLAVGTDAEWDESAKTGRQVKLIVRERQLLTALAENRKLKELLEEMGEYFSSFADDGIRPDEWIMREWADKIKAAVTGE